MLEIVACSHLRGERADPRTAWDFRIASSGVGQQVCVLWRDGEWAVCDGMGTGITDAQIATRLGIDATQALEVRAE